MLWERAAIAALSEPLLASYPPSRDPDYRPFRRDAERLFDARTASSANALFVWRHRHSALNRWYLVTKEVEKLYHMPIKEAWNAGKSIEAEIRDLSQGNPENDQALVSLVWAVVASLPSGSPLEEALPHLLSALAFARAGSDEESRHNVLQEFSDTELETEDFPSWFLLQAPGDAVEPDVAPDSPTGDAYRILNSLQRSSKPNVQQLRMELKAARPKLFEAYMRSV